MDKEVKPITRQAWKRLMEKGYAIVRVHNGKPRLFVMQVDLKTGDTELQPVTFDP